MLKYYDVAFAAARLRETVINIDGRACLIRNVGPQQTLEYSDLVTGDVGVVKIDDDKVSAVAPTLGYVNIPRRNAKFLFRMPERRWKQGLPLDLFRAISLDIVGMALNGESYRPFRKCLRTKNLVAFHRNWAVGDGSLHYKGQVVGTVDVNGSVEFHQDKIWLKEAFEEVIR